MRKIQWWNETELFPSFIPVRLSLLSDLFLIKFYFQFAICIWAFFIVVVHVEWCVVFSSDSLTLSAYVFCAFGGHVTLLFLYLWLKREFVQKQQKQNKKTRTIFAIKSECVHFIYVETSTTELMVLILIWLVLSVLSWANQPLTAINYKLTSANYRFVTIW